MAEEFVLNLTGEDIAGLSPHAGGGFSLIKFGDYKARITDVRQKAKEGGDKPHVMMFATFQILAAYDPANQDQVGMTMDELYAGSRESPPFMQRRLASLIRGASIQTGAKPITSAEFLGRELDITIVWEKSKPEFDEAEGKEKCYINGRVRAERPCGTARPSTIDPKRDSAAAVKYMQSEGSDDTEAAAPATPPKANGAPWAQSAPPANALPPAVAAPQPPPPAPGMAAAPPVQPAQMYQPETAVAADPNVHVYRAYVKMKTEFSEQARQGLIQNRVDPDGPINVDLLPADVRAAWDEWSAKNAGGLPGLPPLGGNNATAPANKGARTGTRSPRA